MAEVEEHVDVGPAGRGGRAVPSVLPTAVRGWLGWAAVLAALFVVVGAVLFAGDSEPGAVDVQLSAVVDGAGSSWRQAALATDFLGEPVGAAALVVAVVAGCLLLLRRPRAAVFAVAAAGGTVGATTLLKSLVGRTIHGDGNLSYPSGHTAFLTALALAVALLATGLLGLGRAAGLSLVLAAALVAGAAMGWAQVALGAHYPTDVLGGWCTALAVTPATAWLVDRTADRQDGRRADRTFDADADRTVESGRQGRP
ncbi:phosphatase PAP2 family protein [Streptomyces scabiei]|uniref:phosphatase PAP2 family protein n=1 Tax=Streptomyces scabiei TaxID=1930 RepID=UPI0029906FD1|nr:phosphatase PAP2 family protein [Streptomyces scabiei]MDW8806351.1 phosphatase PAP2 family protein [Streptomyces scabiei]